MASIGFNDNSADLLELYEQSSNDSGVGYIDNYDGLTVNDLLNSGKTLKKPIIVEELPQESIESQIYLLKDKNSSNEENMYIEYIWVDGKYEQIGSNGNESEGEDENFEPISKDSIENITG